MWSLFDLHCDTSFRLLGQDLKQQLSLRNNSLHIDLTRAGKYSSYVQCFACYTSPIEVLPNGMSPVDVLRLEYDCIIGEISNNSDLICLARNSTEIYRNISEGRMSAILSLEGTAGINYDPGALLDLYEKGFRMTTLGWNEKNPLSGSHCTGGGLTARGREYVKEAQRLGMIVDVSHISDEAFWNIMDMSDRPVIASHSNSRRMHPVSRNLTDEMFSAICQTGGVAGINLFTDFLGKNVTLDTVCDHIIHFLELDVSGEHISLGGDLDGCERLPYSFTGVESYSLLADRLIERGVSVDIIHNIFWDNAMGVIKKCCT